MTNLNVRFGGADCGIVSGTDTSKTCTLKHLPYGGDHLIELTDANGLVPVAATPQNVPVTIKSVNPTIKMNQNGGDVITITGTGFPNEASLVTVEF